MPKTFQYRIYPTPSQETRLLRTLEECRWLYNAFVAHRKTMWERCGESPTMFDQQYVLTQMKKDRCGLKEVHSQVLQNVATRIDLAFKAFFRRVKSGEKAGYPRFRGRGRYDSITYPQAPSGCRLDGNTLHLSKIGKVRVVLHRPLGGTPKTCTIRRTSTNKWFVTFSCEWEPMPLPESTEQVGIDVGLACFATFSDGGVIDNPRFFRSEEQTLAKAQRRLSNAEKGTLDRAKRRKVVARIHEHIGWQRENFVHQETRRIVDRYRVIAIEDLEVNRMVHNRCLSKSIADAAWSMFAGTLAWKAECAARLFVKVNPAYTSQDCSSCGHRQKMPLSDRVYACPCCGVKIDRDHNAALNILGLGRQALGIQSVEAAPL